MMPSSVEERAGQIAELRAREQDARREVRERRARATQDQVRLDAIPGEVQALIDEGSATAARLQQTLTRANQRETEALGFARQAAALEAQG